MTLAIIITVYLIGCVLAYGFLTAKEQDSDLPFRRIGKWAFCFTLLWIAVLGCVALDRVNGYKHRLQFRSDASIERRKQAKQLPQPEFDFDTRPYEAERWK